jgi:HEAT repeat protein
VFGISQLPNDQSIPLLVDLLKHNRSREVRKKAAFWLGQKNDPPALAAIKDVLRQ